MDKVVIWKGILIELDISRNDIFVSLRIKEPISFNSQGVSHENARCGTRTKLVSLGWNGGSKNEATKNP